MNTTTTTFPSHSLGRLPSLAAPLQRFTAWLRGKASAATQYQTSESAASLYARAAHYERTQPGYAADLRAAAEAMDRHAARAAR
jgi:uncharacterized lipoprotein YmbA